MRSIWGELARRNVLRVGIAYLAAAWLLVQVADTILPNFNAPAWIIRALIISAVLGFPVALLLAWFYEVTPDGVKAESELKPGKAVRFSGRRIDLAIIGLLVLAVGFLLVRPPPEEPFAVLANSVAVLPFDNLSPNPDDAYFAAGIHEELLNQLARIENLRVIARTSVLQYAGAARPITEIARELGVGTVMEGSVRYAGNRVRVTAQLIDAAQDGHLWSEVYERDLSDIFAIQADIAAQITRALQAEFSDDERARIATQATSSAAAYELYLKGSAAYPDDALTHRYLDQAIALDPDFSLAYIRKAFSHARSAESITGVLEDPSARAEHVALARQNAERALTLDPNAGYAHAILARVENYELRWREGRSAFERALALSPNDAEVLLRFSLDLANAGESERAMDFLRRARALSPLSTSGYFGWVPLALGDWDAAAAAFRASTAAAPSLPLNFLELGYAEGCRGNRAEALSALRMAEQLSAGDRRPSWIARFMRGYARAGSSQDVRRLFETLNELANEGPVSATSWYVAYKALGDFDQALAWLHTALDTADTYGAYFAEMRTRNHATEDIWNLPAFQDARRKLGFLDN